MTPQRICRQGRYSENAYLLLCKKMNNGVFRVRDQKLENAQGPAVRPAPTLRFRADHRPNDEAHDHQVEPDITRDTYIEVCDNLPRG